MNYKKIYDSLIERGLSNHRDCYTESHHILPRCLGGKDNKSNLVDLTPEEHYVAHQLLVKIHPNEPGLKIAAAMMIPQRPSNKLYGWVRRNHAAAMKVAQSGVKNSQYNTKWVTNGVIEKKINIDESIEDGWEYGRLSGYLTKQRKLQIKLEFEYQRELNNANNIQKSRNKWITDGIHEEKITSHDALKDGWVYGRTDDYYIKQKEKLVASLKKESENKIIRLNNINELHRLHEIYLVEGFDGVKNDGYKHSRANLVQQFAKHVSDFKPQNGKKRCKNDTNDFFG